MRKQFINKNSYRPDVLIKFPIIYDRKDIVIEVERMTKKKGGPEQEFAEKLRDFYHDSLYEIYLVVETFNKAVKMEKFLDESRNIGLPRYFFSEYTRKWEFL